MTTADSFVFEADVDPDTQFAEWVILEVMGHRRLAGYLTEQEIAGKGFLRLDVPGAEGESAATQLYNPSSVYCITPTTKDVACALASRTRPAPVQRWELEPARPLSSPDADADGAPWWTTQYAGGPPMCDGGGEE